MTLAPTARSFTADDEAALTLSADTVYCKYLSSNLWTCRIGISSKLQVHTELQSFRLKSNFVPTWPEWVQHHQCFRLESGDFLLKWCWNSDVADVCVNYCEWKIVDCRMSSFFMSLCSRVKTNPHETGAPLHDLLAGTLWEVVCPMSLHFLPLLSLLQSCTVRRRTAVHHGKTVNVF